MAGSSVLGRMLQVDPLADNYASHTPYQYALNNPITFNDPLGDRISNRGDDIWYSLNSVSSDPDAGMGGQGGGWSSDLWEIIDSNLGTNSGLIGSNAEKSDFWGKIGSIFSGTADGGGGQVYGYSGKDNAYGFFIQAGMTGAGNMGTMGGGKLLSDVIISSHFVAYYSLEEQTQGGANNESSFGFGPGSDLWNKASNYMTGIGMAVDGAAFSLGRALDKRLAYSPRDTKFGQWMPKSLPVGPTRIGGFNFPTGLC